MSHDLELLPPELERLDARLRSAASSPTDEEAVLRVRERLQAHMRMHPTPRHWWNPWRSQLLGVGAVGLAAAAGIAFTMAVRSGLIQLHSTQGDRPAANQQLQQATATATLNRLPVGVLQLEWDSATGGLSAATGKLSGLEPNTKYVLEIVRANCGASGTRQYTGSLRSDAAGNWPTAGDRLMLLGIPEGPPPVPGSSARLIAGARVVCANLEIPQSATGGRAPVSASFFGQRSEDRVGTADLKVGSDGVLHVKLSLSGLDPGREYAVHIHDGHCTGLGTVAYDLGTVKGDGSGRAGLETNIKAVDSIPASRFGWSIDVHQSGPTPVACGDVVNPRSLLASDRLSPGQPLKLTTLRMLTPTTGWAIGFGRDSDLSRVLRTADGGATWKDVTPKEALTRSGAVFPFFLDASHAWFINVEVGAGSRPGATVFRTSDGGATWQQGAPPQWVCSSSQGCVGQGGYTQGLTFVDAQHGWLWLGTLQAGANTFDLYRTADGGGRWEAVASKSSLLGIVPTGCSILAVTFVTETTGWASGQCQAAGTAFYVTRDGGRTWQNQPLTVAAPGLFDRCSCFIQAPVFTSPREGTLMAFTTPTATPTLVYATHDGGDTWAVLTLPESARAPFAPVFINATDGWVVAVPEVAGGGPQPSLYATRDGGRHWTQLPPNESLTGAMLNFVTLDRGWALRLGIGGRELLQTSDGGRSWRLVNPVTQ